jgi:cell division protein FtsN
MIALLEEAQKTLASRRGSKSANSERRNLPLQARSTHAQTIEASPDGEESLQDSTVITPTLSENNTSQEAANSPVVTELPSVPNTAKSLTSPIPFGRGTPAPVEVVPTSAPAASPQMISADKEISASLAASGENHSGGWGIQVGAFEDKTQAENAVNKALTLASSALSSARIAVNSSDAVSKTIHRARIDNLREDQARKACQILISQKVPCFTYQAN